MHLCHRRPRIDQMLIAWIEWNAWIEWFEWIEDWRVTISAKLSFPFA